LYFQGKLKRWQAKKRVILVALGKCSENAPLNAYDMTSHALPAAT
jgi:hypothetical protein